jgi:hypothetical protein
LIQKTNPNVDGEIRVIWLGKKCGKGGAVRHLSVEFSFLSSTFDPSPSFFRWQSNFHRESSSHVVKESYLQMQMERVIFGFQITKW